MLKKKSADYLLGDEEVDDSLKDPVSILQAWNTQLFF